MAPPVPPPPSSPYDRVEVLMIRWLSNRDIMRQDEMSVQSALSRYGYNVTVFDAQGYGQTLESDVSTSRVADVVLKWAQKFDVGTPEPKKTLLVVMYSGHGSKRSKRRLFAVEYDMPFPM